ncbi:MAG TPA: chorismate mutase [Chitinophaga sp.]|nr:chorismate mutase [Chitinophaga sp.]
MKKGLIITGMLLAGLVNANAQTQATSKQDTLTTFRGKINQLDKEIVHLLGERMAAARAIGTYKMNHKMEVTQSARFNEVLQKAISQGKEEGLSEEFIKALYEDIHKESIRQQEALKQ